jgi:hypothetical protein
VLAALEQVGRSGLVVGSVEWVIDGTVVYVLDDAVFLLFFLEVDFLDLFVTIEVSAVAGDMT